MSISCAATSTRAASCVIAIHVVTACVGALSATPVYSVNQCAHLRPECVLNACEALLITPPHNVAVAGASKRITRIAAPAVGAQSRLESRLHHLAHSVKG